MHCQLWWQLGKYCWNSNRSLVKNARRCHYNPEVFLRALGETTSFPDFIIPHGREDRKHDRLCPTEPHLFTYDPFMSELIDIGLSLKAFLLQIGLSFSNKRGSFGTKKFETTCESNFKNSERLIPVMLTMFSINIFSINIVNTLFCSVEISFERNINDGYYNDLFWSPKDPAQKEHYKQHTSTFCQGILVWCKWNDEHPNFMGKKVLDKLLCFRCPKNKSVGEYCAGHMGKVFFNLAVVSLLGTKLTRQQLSRSICVSNFWLYS